MKQIEADWQQKLEYRKLHSTLRTLLVKTQTIDFSSNDYLGFAKHNCNDRLSIRKMENGAGSSRLIAGNTILHEQVEKELAAFHHAETGLLFNSGYDANIGVLGCVAQRGDTILFDELSHASIREGIKLSLAKSHSFKHNDLEDLEKQLQEAEGNIFIVTEGVFSMDGDVAPLQEMVGLAKKYNAGIIIDEAHSNGILGAGKGLVSELNLEKEVLIRVHTFGKALGCHGAVVLGSETLRSYLINYARSFIFTTAIAPHSVLLIQKLYQELSKTKQITVLFEKINLFKKTLHPEKRKQFLPSNTPIQSWIIQGSELCRIKAKKLQEAGFDIKPIVSPTVSKGEERIRICIHSFNTDDEIINLAEAINSL